MSKITILKAQPNHYLAIRQIVGASHQSIFYNSHSIPERDQTFLEWAYSDDTLNRLAQQPNAWQGVAFNETGELVAYTLIQIKGNVAELLRHYVNPTYQRQGIGSQLLDRAIEEIRKIEPIEKVRLAVLRENQVGRSFYQKYGFVHEHDEGVHPEYGPVESYFVLDLTQSDKNKNLAGSR